MKVLRTIILSTCLLAFGTLATLSTKWQSSTYAKGLNGELKRFEHPGVQTLLMFIGMAICLVYYLCRTAFFPSTNQQRPKLWEPVLLVPTILDLTQNALAVVGLLWIPVSIWQMLNGAIVVFGAIFSVVILKRKMTPLRWVAIGFATIGLALVGTSGILNESSEGVSGKFIIGIALVLGGQVVGSLHMISEEKLMSYTDPFDPDHLAGIQGLNGIVLMAFLLPIMYFIPLGDDKLDNSIEAFVQIINSEHLTYFVPIYIICSTVFNYTSLAIAAELSTVHRTLIDSCRTIFVWVVSIIIYYSGIEQYGEGWEHWSWMQLVGFIVLLLSTLAYNFLPSPQEESSRTEPLSINNEPLLPNENMRLLP